MTGSSLYDDDIVTWAERQATALRALGARSELSNAIDWENVAEEIESVGRSDIGAVEGLLTRTLAYLSKRLSAPDAPASRHWRQETGTFQLAARVRYERSMRQRIDWNKIRRSAQETAEIGLAPFGDAVLPNLPVECPVTPEELLAGPFDIDAVLLRIVQPTAPTPSRHS